MQIFFASDHAGFDLKPKLAAYVRELGYEVEDLGAHELVADDDYPDYISLAAARVSEDPENARAIVLGGSGQGEAIVANKFSHVRAIVFNGASCPPGAVASPEEHEIMLSRQHNDSNILSLGARFLTEEEAKEAVKTWLETPFSGEERHVRRLEKLSNIEKNNFKNSS